MFKKIIEKIQNKRLLSDFNKRKEQIKRENYLKTMAKLMACVKDYELSNSGLLLTDEEAFRQAQNLYIAGKRNGKIGVLNEVIE